MHYSWRFYVIVLLLLAGASGLVWRMVYLSMTNRPFLVKQSESRTLRVVDIPAYRGMILDRNGTPLAISTPVDSLWANPQVFQATNTQLSQLSKQLGLPVYEIKQKIKKNTDKEFVYLMRGLPPETAEQIKALKIPGLSFLREYRRYYPQGEVTAHVIGSTNIDDNGQEGLELAYNRWLQGIPGKRQVIKDRLGQTVTSLGVLREPQQGHDLTLSLDSRIQFIAYKALQATVPKYQADSGSIVVLDVKTGEILAMANLPSYNPNDRTAKHDSRYRNRAVTDVFEPGSVMKAFSVANALASGKYTPDTLIDTGGGRIEINGNPITDDSDNGVITVTQVLQKSSNIGVLKMTLSLPPESLSNLLGKMGFGERTDSGFPGEVAGVLPRHSVWKPIELATLAYGYGISVTALQLTQAYAIIAANGVKHPVSFVKTDQAAKSERAMDATLANTMLNLLHSVAEGGTGRQARIPGYQIGGKTGTAYMAGPNGYQKDRYQSSFVGIAPVSDPRLVVAVVLHGVHGNVHMAAFVAAPTFATVMQGALRYLDIAPDKTLVSSSEALTSNVQSVNVKSSSNLSEDEPD